MKRQLLLIYYVLVTPLFWAEAKEKNPAPLTVTLSHIHVGVKDLKEVSQSIRKLWDIEPNYQDERMSSISFGKFTIIFDLSEEVAPVTIGFDSKNCDVDSQKLISRGAAIKETCQNKPWGVRATYIKGPGNLIFELEQPIK